MTTIIRYRTRGAAPARAAAKTHLFEVGQAVRLTGGYWVSVAETSGIYHITATLPPRGNSPQYRIRNEEERHERVTTQDSLELVTVLPSWETGTLLERTFGQVRAVAE